MTEASRVIRSGGFRWEEVPVQEYQQPGSGFRGITRQVLVGEAEGEAAVNFITRYFEIEPGGYSSLERHRHPHTVVVLRGSGRVILENQAHEIGPLDAVYVAPDCLHQFQAGAAEELGFICIVDRERDTGRPATEADVAALPGRTLEVVKR